jgi:Fe-S cluster assembly protein SufB
MATVLNPSAVESSTLAIGTGDAIGEINKYDFRTDSPAVFKARRGIDADIVSQISEMKREPGWMRDFRLKSLEIFNSKPMPHWGGDIGINFQDIFYYLKPTEQQGKTWEEVPDAIKKTFDRLGIPEAERKFLSGVKAQFESEVVYGSLQEDLAKQGVIFTASIPTCSGSISGGSFRPPTTSLPRSIRPSGRVAHSSMSPRG